MKECKSKQKMLFFVLIMAFLKVVLLENVSQTAVLVSLGLRWTGP